MRRYTRNELDEYSRNLKVDPVIDQLGDAVLVNGMLGEYQLWTLKSDTSVRPCLTGEVGGMPGSWENWITAWHSQNLGDYDVYVDVGANCGYFSILAAMDGKFVVAVEPNPKYSELLLDSAYLNGVAANVDVWTAALSDTSGVVDLEVPPELHGGASIRHSVTNLEGRSQPVRALLLDELELDPTKSTLIKLDVEGAEQMVWHGASRTNEFVRPTYIIEYTPRHYEGNFFDELQAYGTVTMVDFNGDEQPVTKDEANSSDDWITLVIRPYEEV